MENPLAPNGALLCKLGSIVVHAQELTSDDGHHFDKVALDALLVDPQVVEWLAAMHSRALVPAKRKG